MAIYESESSNSGEAGKSRDGIVNNKNKDSPNKSMDITKRCVKWIEDLNYKKEMQRLKIPDDPYKWINSHVRHWLHWAISEFQITGLNLDEWNLNGEQICNMSLQEFHKKCKSDPGDKFWTHITLLRKSKYVAVVKKMIIQLQEVSPQLITLKDNRH